MLRKFEEENHLTAELSTELEKINASLPQGTYQKIKKQTNEIEENLFLEKDDKIIDMCHLHIEKDIKLGRLSLIPIQKEKSRKLISLATHYIFTTYNVEEVFLEVSPKDKALMTYLDSKEYENLGSQDNKIIYLKEKEKEKNIQRMVV